MRTHELENAVMDLYDAGRSRDEIAAALQVSQHTVRSVLGYMRVGRDDIAFGPIETGKATQKLIAAIAQHHPERKTQ